VADELLTLQQEKACSSICYFFCSVVVYFTCLCGRVARRQVCDVAVVRFKCENLNVADELHTLQQEKAAH